MTDTARSRRGMPLTVVAVAAMLLLGAACGTGLRPHLRPRNPLDRADPTVELDVKTVFEAKAPRRGHIPITTVAQATASNISIYDGPDGHWQTTLSRQRPRQPLVFVVRHRQGDWLQVLLPVRPNGSSGWVRTSAVTMTRHRFRIVIELRAHRITVYEGLAMIERDPIGVGTTDTPTPLGWYYTTELFRPRNPDGLYGAYAYGLSGFSNVLRRFNGRGGIIGIHGTNEPWLLGRDVSHGCIRMSNAAITRLARTLPLGVPVAIVT